jgi:hypothetical protein
MSKSAWDSADSDVQQGEAIRPLWTLEHLHDREAVLKWAEGTYQTELKRWAGFRATAVRNLQIYKGKFVDSPQQRPNPVQAAMQGYRPPRAAKLIVNHLQDLVVQKVSRAIKNKPSVIISPANSEYSDRVAAKVVKAWTDFQLYRIDFDAVVTAVLTAALIMGEAYPAVLWDPNAGELHPDWVDAEREATERGEKPRLPVTDEDGKPVLGEDGKPLFIEQPVHVGDITIEARTPLNTMIELCGDHSKSRYAIFEDLHDIDELKALYPKYADQIERQADLNDWAGAVDVPRGSMGNKILVRTLYWKGSEFLGQGRFLRWTNKCLLESAPLPERFTGLPVTRFTDIDIPNEQRGMSFFAHGRALNACINDLTSMIRRNAVMLSAPKWFIPRGGKIKRETLGNDISLVEFDGPTPPTLAAPPPLSAEIIQLRNELRQDMQTILGSSDSSRGNPPPNVRSALALQALDEQEEQRANSGVAKHGALIRDTIKLALATASAYYEKDDKRLIPIVGKDNALLLKEFDVTMLSRNFDVRVSSNTGLPSGKSLRTQTLIELKQAFPTALKDEMVLDMLQIGDSDKFFDKSTVAVKAAAAENETLLGGQDIEDPAPYENLLVHWSSHVLEMQSRGYKAALPEIVREKFEVHLGGTELLMMKAARKNSAFALELVKLPSFPLFLEISEQDAVLLDRARTGNPLSLTEMNALYKTGTLPQVPGQAPAAGGPIVPGSNLGGANGGKGGRPGEAAIAQEQAANEGAPDSTQALTPDQEAAAQMQA